MSTRDRMVATTSALLQRQGYAATGLNQVVADSSAPKGSLYFHFPGGKEQLACEALASSGAFVASALESVLSSSTSTASGLKRWVALLASQLEATGFGAGCPIATVALEAAPTSEAISDATARAFEAWIAAVAARLRRDGMTKARARTRAVATIAAIEGALVLSKAMRSTAPLHDVGGVFRELLRHG